MNLEFFPHFLRSNFPMVKSELSEEAITTIGVGFKKYLEKKFEGKEDNLEPIWNIDANKVIMNQVNKEPFKVNGYHPALLIHFQEFCKAFSDEKSIGVTE